MYTIEASIHWLANVHQGCLVRNKANKASPLLNSHKIRDHFNILQALTVRIEDIVLLKNRYVNVLCEWA